MRIELKQATCFRKVWIPEIVTKYSNVSGSIIVLTLLPRIYIFILRAKTGNGNKLKLFICHKNTTINAKTVYVAYATLLDYHDSYGYLKDNLSLRIILGFQVRKDCENTDKGYRGAHTLIDSCILKKFIVLQPYHFPE